MTELPQPKHKRRRILLYILLGMIILCVAVLAASALSNRLLPTGPARLDHLTGADQARIAEALHLKEALGEQIWPGWGKADIPVIIYNSEFAFLYGYSQQPQGWEALEDETFDGQPIYRQSGADHDAFTELLAEDTWAGSMSTKWEVDSFLISQIRGAVPAPINEVVPYRLLILPSEQYMAGILHETFHAFQATVARRHFDDAELAYGSENQYSAAYEAMRDAWASETQLLIDAMDAQTDDEAAELVRRFLQQRTQRRKDGSLDSTIIDFERRYEWLEGLGKYVELGIWQAASESPQYTPLPDMSADGDFQEYRTFSQRWSSEMFTMRNDSTENRLYYTGMAEARLLDRLMPGWKERVMQEGAWLEDLLAEASISRPK